MKDFVTCSYLVYTSTVSCLLKIYVFLSHYVPDRVILAIQPVFPIIVVDIIRHEMMERK